MKGKLASSTRVSIMHRPLPEEANHAGSVHGGNLMRHLDEVGSLVAMRYARSRIATVAVEYMSFLGPVLPNEIVHFHGSVNAVWNSSMEVGIRTEAEDPLTGAVRHVGTSYMTFVSLDENGAPRPLPLLVAENEEDERRMADATRRMAFSLIEHNRKHEASRLSGLKLEVMPGQYAICKLPADAPLPDFSVLPASSFASLSRTSEELSLVLAEENIPVFWEKNPSMEVFSGFACLKVVESATIHKVGMLSSLTTVLASAQISVYCVFTYNTCYILLNAQNLERAKTRLRNAGHRIN